MSPALIATVILGPNVPCSYYVSYPNILWYKPAGILSFLSRCCPYFEKPWGLGLDQPVTNPTAVAPTPADPVSAPQYRLPSVETHSPTTMVRASEEQPLDMLDHTYPSDNMLKICALYSFKRKEFEINRPMDRLWIFALPFILNPPYPWIARAWKIIGTLLYCRNWWSK